MKDVTLIVTDNNRPDLLRRTLTSFLEMNTYPLAEMHIHNDGPDRFMRTLMQEFKQFNWHFSGKIIGYAASLDYLISLIKTEYVFTSESDWDYYKNPGFIERSMKILEENTDVHQVWIRDSTDHGHPLGVEKELSGITVRPVLPNYRKIWHGWTWNPTLRRMSDLKMMFPNGLIEYRDEADQSQYVTRFNYKAVSLVDTTIRHTGYNRRSINFRA